MQFENLWHSETMGGSQIQNVCVRWSGSCLSLMMKAIFPPRTIRTLLHKSVVTCGIIARGHYLNRYYRTTLIMLTCCRIIGTLLISDMSRAVETGANFPVDQFNGDGHRGGSDIMLSAPDTFYVPALG